MVERLTAEDRLILWPDEAWPQDIGALAILDGRELVDGDGRFRIEVVCDAMASRLHLAPRFRQVLHTPRRPLGGPMWIDDRDFDLNDHIGVVALEPPADEAELLREIERVRAHRLDRSRPLWEMWFFTGLGDNRVALFARMHHVIADGIAGVATFARFLDIAPDAEVPPGPRWFATRPPEGRELFADNVRRHSADLGRRLATLVHPMRSVRAAVRALPAIREMLFDEPGPRTSLNRVIGGDRNLALVRSDLDLVKDIAHAHGAKVNDVLLAAIAGGLRALFQGRGESVDDLVLRISVPVSLHGMGNVQNEGNLISEMVVPVAVGEDDAGRRLEQIAAETAVRKKKERPSLGTMFAMRALGPVMIKLIARQRVNVTSTNIPGPPVPLYFAGARILEMFPLMNLVGNQTLGVGAMSYAGRFNVLVVGDRDTYPDVDVFADGVRRELSGLATSVGADASRPRRRAS